RSVLVDQHSPGPAGAARPAGADLSSPPAHSRRRWSQAVEIDAGNEPARVARARRDGGRYQADGRAWRVWTLRSSRKPPELVLFWRTPWHAWHGAEGAPWRVQGRKRNPPRSRHGVARRAAAALPARGRRRSPPSRTTSAPHSPASWRSANCWRAPRSASASV